MWKAVRWERKCHRNNYLGKWHRRRWAERHPGVVQEAPALILTSDSAVWSRCVTSCNCERLHKTHSSRDASRGGVHSDCCFTLFSLKLSSNECFSTWNSEALLHLHCSAAPAHAGGGGTRPINKCWLQCKGHFICESPAAWARGPQAFWFPDQSASFYLRWKLQMAAAPKNPKGNRLEDHDATLFVCLVGENCIFIIALFIYIYGGTALMVTWLKIWITGDWLSVEIKHLAIIFFK